MQLKDADIKDLEKKGYRFVGSHRHAAVKVCHWTKKSMTDEGVCYKEKFYDIKSHRCLQMSPSIPFCHHKCLFCWRDVSVTSTQWKGPSDEPQEIIEECIKAQRRLLVGYFGNEKANHQKIQQAQHPNNAAISLAGEPMLYPEIEGLLEEFNKRKFTTFLVSNGLTPEKLENLSIDPTQLYLSLDAPNKKVYNDLCLPQVENGWQKLNQSLDLISSFNSRTVIRMTCVKDYNMLNPQEYADIISRSNPDYVEIKAYMYVGSSRDRLNLDNMPSYEDVKNFAGSIANLCGKKIVDEAFESRVLLLK
ncbi:MAG TPA: 4-demethylwyosine synthase TYW1 [Methanobacteriaceae archaeon]|nr:4-demethylwyosine synthase TYW1 [Methanobacteriaceae archaeon]